MGGPCSRVFLDKMLKCRWRYDVVTLLSCARVVNSDIMRQLSSSQYAAFLAEKSVAAVHFDAAWGVRYRQKMRRRMRDAAEAIGEQANFGEVDCDIELALARSVPIINVPTVAYYRDGELVVALIGSNQT
jgi:thioredoxin family protein